MGNDLSVEQINEAKSLAIKNSLKNGRVSIFVDAREDGVLVPRYLKDQSSLRLDLSYEFINGDQISVDEDLVKAVLRFRGQYFPVEVPMSAVYAVGMAEEAEMYVFRGSVPDDIIVTPNSDGDTPAWHPQVINGGRE